MSKHDEDNEDPKPGGETFQISVNDINEVVHKIPGELQAEKLIGAAATLAYVAVMSGFRKDSVGRLFSEMFDSFDRAIPTSERLYVPGEERDISAFNEVRNAAQSEQSPYQVEESDFTSRETKREKSNDE